MKRYAELWYQIFKDGTYVCEESVVGTREEQIRKRVIDLHTCYPAEEGYTCIYVGKLGAENFNKATNKELEERMDKLEESTKEMYKDLKEIERFLKELVGR